MRISDWSSDVCSSDLVADAGKPDQHWQVDPRDHLYIGLAHQRNGEVGRRSAEHAGEQDHTLAAVDPCGGGRYVGPARLHVVIWAHTDRLHPFLTDRKSTRLNSSHSCASRMTSTACKKKYP